MLEATLLVIFICLLEVCADILFKRWSNGKVEFNFNMFFGIIVYICIGILYGFSLRFGLLSIVSSLWQGFSLLFTFLLAIFYFKEKPNIKQICCIILVFIGTIGLIIF